MEFYFLCPENVDERSQYRGLARSGSAGENTHLGCESGADCFGLFGGELDGGFFLSPSDGGVDFDGGQPGGHCIHALHDGGDLALGAVLNGKLDEA